MDSTNTDLEYAKGLFAENEFTFVIVNDNKIVAKSTERGVAPFFSAVHVKVQGASVADKVVGKAVAFLAAHFGIVAVYSPVMSRSAYSVLQEYSIYAEANATVPMIMNRNRDGQCPIEKLIWNCSTPQEAYLFLKEKFEK